jgi:serine/threonine protein kinase
MYELPEKFKKKHDIEEELSSFEGGQKNVHIVKLKNGNKVALKVFKKFSVRDSKEIKILQKYHEITGIPKIIKIIEYGEKTILVEEFIEGENLNDLLASNKYYQNSDDIAELMTKLIGILSHVWNDRIIHRDLKPENIIINSQNDPIVLDFGIMKDEESSTITDTGFQPNSLIYASPEQIFGEKNDISYRTDFFCLGIIAYHLYHNELPFGSSRDGIIQSFKDNKVLDIVDDCRISKFYNFACRIKVSERPRDMKLLLKTLEI